MEQPDLIESMVTTLAQASMPGVSLAWMFSELHVLPEVPLLPFTPGRGSLLCCNDILYRLSGDDQRITYFADITREITFVQHVL